MAENGGQQLRWYQGLKKYHWWVLAIGVMSWMFDCMDQQFFVRSRQTALRQLMHEEIAAFENENRDAFRQEAEAAAKTDAIEAGQHDEEVESRTQAKLDAEVNNKLNKFGYLVTALMIFGWSVGGFFFGIYGDKLGRVKTLAITILVYSLFTGLSGLAVGKWDFCAYRFIMGCGIGGAFATAATLIAETMPVHARAMALGMFQALSAAGNIIGNIIARYWIRPEFEYLEAIMPDGVAGWRILFFIGTVPAILAVLIMRTIQEPDTWKEAQTSAQDNLDRQLGDIKGLFGTPRWRTNTFVGLSLAVIGVIGLWGIGFWSPELLQEVFGDKLNKEELSNIKSMGLIIQNFGAFFGMVVFTVVATHLGRRLAFGLAFLFGWVVVSGVFLFLSEPWQVYPMFFLLGFATLALFGGYAIYFPELYPTRLRSTGTGFCYNVGRVLAAMVMLFKLPIDDALAGTKDSFRTVMAGFATVYLLGFIVLFWAPETKGKPLPTDDDVA
jgi:MFS family permease